MQLQRVSSTWVRLDIAALFYDRSERTLRRKVRESHATENPIDTIVVDKRTHVWMPALDDYMMRPDERN